MRIIHSVLTAGLGGTERYVADLANAQTEDGHDVTVMLRAKRYREAHNLFADWLDSGVKTVPIGCRFPHFKMRRTIHRVKPDILHTHHARDARYAAHIAPNALRIATLHSGDYEDRLYQNHHRLICITLAQLKRVPCAHKSKATFIPNWLPKAAEPSHVKRTTPALRQAWNIDLDPRPILGTATRLAHQKGLDLLLEAYARLETKSWRLIILGEGAQEALLQQLIAKYGLQNDVLLAGLIDPAEAGYNLFDAFILPSRWENFGLVILEAMRAQLPIITTRCDGPLSILSEDPNTLWADPDDIDSLEVALLQLIENAPQKPISYPSLSHYQFDRIYQKTMTQYTRKDA